MKLNLLAFLILVGIAPFEKLKGTSYYLPPIWKREYRASFLDPKKEKKQKEIAMKWNN